MMGLYIFIFSSVLKFHLILKCFKLVIFLLHGESVNGAVQRTSLHDPERLQPTRANKMDLFHSCILKCMKRMQL